MTHACPTRRSSDLGVGDNRVSGDALATGDEGSTPTATADNTATTTMTGADGGEGMALSSAGDDGLNSILGGILGAGVGGGHAYDEVLGSFGLDTGGMIGGIVTGLDEFLIRGGDGKDTISGDALASGKTGIRSEEHTSELQSL